MSTVSPEKIQAIRRLQPVTGNQMLAIITTGLPQIARVIRFPTDLTMYMPITRETCIPGIVPITNGSNVIITHGVIQVVQITID